MMQPNSPTKRNDKVVFPIFSFMSEQQLRTRCRTCIHLKSFNSFLVLAGRKQISGIIRCLKRFHFYHSNYNYCGKRSRTSKNNYYLKKLETQKMVCRSNRSTLSILARKKSERRKRHRKLSWIALINRINRYHKN